MDLNSKKKKTVSLKAYNPFVALIADQFEQRKKKNARYSMRAFSTLLGVDQSLLSKVLNGKRALSADSMEKCLRALNISAEKTNSILKKMNASKICYHDLNDDIFQIISEWYHFAILELITTKDFSSDIQFISNRLKITLEQTSAALDRLNRHRFISVKNGKYSLSRSSNTWFNNEKTNDARRLLQKRLLEKSLSALKMVPFELRDHNSLTVAINKSKLPEFKEILKETQRQLADSFQQFDEFDEVYQLTVSFFPLSHSGAFP